MPKIAAQGFEPANEEKNALAITRPCLLHRKLVAILMS